MGEKADISTFEQRIAALEQENARLAAELAAVRAQLGARRDVTPRRATELQLSERRSLFSALFANAPIGMALIALDGELLLVNDRLCEFLGRPREEMLGKTFAAVTHPDDLEIDLAQFRQLAAGALDRYRLEKRYLLPDGSIAYGLRAVSLLRDADGSPLYAVGQVVELTDRKRAEAALAAQAEELRSLSLRDELTGLYNRRGFVALAEQQLATARRLQARMLLLFADLDGLKPINDRFGHEAGDRALAETAALLRTHLRESDVVGRLGGDEFAVAAMEDPADGGGAAAIGARLERAIAARNAATKEPWELSLSVGTVTVEPAEPVELEKLLQLADQRMYANKRSRNAGRP